MTVRELIEQLQQQPPEMPVAVGRWSVRNVECVVTREGMALVQTPLSDGPWWARGADLPYVDFGAPPMTSIAVIL